MKIATHHCLRAVAASLLVGAALSACTTVGAGSGIVESNHRSVKFLWEARDATHGSISARLPYGRKFVGSYTQLANGSDEVDAKLQDEDGKNMSCVFHLAHSSGGMAEGGKGECTFGANTVDVVLPRSLPFGA